MTAKIVDGRAIAQKIKDELREEISNTDKAPQMDIIIVGENAVTDSFVRAKEKCAKEIGVIFKKHKFPETTTTTELVTFIKDLGTTTNGMVVQLPLPKHIDTHTVLLAIPVEKDVDVLSESTFGHFVTKTTKFIPPVAGAVREILERHKIPLNINVVIIGKGRLVGAPVRTLFEHEGAKITVLDSETSTKEFTRALQEAEIIVSGVGKPNLVKREHISKGVVLIDAGTSGSKGSVVGDICEDCINDASLVSKTPGGVGPITVAILFRNLILGIYK